MPAYLHPIGSGRFPADSIVAAQGAMLDFNSVAPLRHVIR